MVTRQAPVTLEPGKIPEKKTQTNQRWFTHNTAQPTQFMPPRETCKCENGSQPTTCQVHTGAYVSLLAPWKTDYNRLPTKTTTYILHVVPITTHMHDRRVSTKEKKKMMKKEGATICFLGFVDSGYGYRSLTEFLQVPGTGMNVLRN